MTSPTKFEEFMSEMIGTAVLIIFGCGVVAAVSLFDESGGVTNINLAWGFAVTMGVYASSISGAHINPAVTLAMASIGKLPWAKVPHYIVAQLIGAFAGAAVVFVVYYGQWIQVDPLFESTAGVFSTFPAVAGFWPGFIDQVVGTAMLVFMILAINDKSNNIGVLGPVLVGFLVMVIGMSLGSMHGYAINPARDFGPRLFSVLAGFQNNGLTDGTGVWIVPIIGPIVGGILGALKYKMTLGKMSERLSQGK